MSLSHIPSCDTARQKVLVSILNWNGGDETLNCLNSLFQSDYEGFDALLIDNASTDNSTDIAQRAFPQIEVLRNKNNLGFAGGQNQGINFAIEKGYEYIWILNNDTDFDSDVLGKLIEMLDKDDSIGSLSPVLMDAENREERRIQFCGCSINWKFRIFEKYKTIDEAWTAQAENPENFFLWGTALLVRVSVLKQIGGFDEKLFAYFEDMDLSLKIVKAGLLNCIAKETIVFHAGITDAKQRPPHYVYFNTRNRYFFWMKHLPWSQRFNFTRQYVAGALVLAASWHETRDVQRETATLLGIWDALIRRGGGWDRSRILPKWLPPVLLSHPYIFVNILQGNFYRLAQGVFKQFLTVIRKN